MRPTVIPDELVEEGQRRIVISAPDGDLTNTEIAPVEAVLDVVQIAGLGASTRISLRIVLDDDDLETLAASKHMWISLFAARLPPLQFFVELPVDREPPQPTVVPATQRVSCPVCDWEDDVSAGTALAALLDHGQRHGH